MGDVFIMGGGSGGGLSKCTIIVHIDTDSTVAVYSNSTHTTLVKTAKEVGTGDYFITGLEGNASGNKTYYILATKGVDTSEESVTFSSTIAGIKEVEMSYGTKIFYHQDQCTSITGGWLTKNWNDHNELTVTYPSGQNYANLYWDNAAYSQGVWYTKNKISLSGINFIQLEYEQSKNRSDDFQLCIHTSPPGYSQKTAVYSLKTATTSITKINFNVESYNDSYYIGLGGANNDYTPSGAQTIKVYSIILKE